MTYCSVVTVLALVGLTKKRFGHYAILKILSLRSPSRNISHDLLLDLGRIMTPDTRIIYANIWRQFVP